MPLCHACVTSVISYSSEGSSVSWIDIYIERERDRERDIDIPTWSQNSAAMRGPELFLFQLCSYDLSVTASLLDLSVRAAVG